MKIILSTIGYGRSGGTESVARDLAWGLLQKGYDFTILTETSVGDHTPIHVTGDLNILRSADVVFQVGAFSMMDYEVLEMRRRRLFQAPLLVWSIEPCEKFFRWMTDPQTGLPQDKIMFAYSVEYALHHLQHVGLGHLGVKIRYGVPTVVGRPGFRKKRGITTSKMFLTAGGFDIRKKQHELIKTFKEVNPPDTTLVVTGHRGLGNAPQEQEGVRVLVPDDRQELMDAMFESDLLIMNSEAEGFGLVLLEAMFNKTPWAANKVGATRFKEDLADYGYVYENEDGLKRAFAEYGKIDVMKAFRFAEANHTTDVMVNDAEAALRTLLTKSGGK